MADTYLKDLLARYTYQAKHITDKTYSCEAGVFCDNEFYWPFHTELKSWPEHCDKTHKKAKGQAFKVVERLAYLELDAAVKSHKYKLEAQL